MRAYLLFFMMVSIATAYSKKNDSLETTEQVINKLYKDISGFSIGSDESEKITQEGGAPTYGEITIPSAHKLFKELSITNNDIFYDLGSGVGKVALQVYLETPVKKATGIELSPTRFAHAQKVKEFAKKQGIKARGKSLEFRNENITTAIIDDATILYMCSTCYSDALMKSILNTIKKLPKLRWVATLKSMPENDHLELVKTLPLEMTWSSNTPVYLYKPKQKNFSKKARPSDVIANLYKDRNAFCISDAELKIFGECSMDATYGEITDKAVATLIKEIKPTKEDVFYDLGSGAGRMVSYFYLASPVKKAVGIELSPTRHNLALDALKELENKNSIHAGRKLEFIRNNFLDENINDATIVYLPSTCFSEKLMADITKKLESITHPITVITLQQLPKSKAFSLTKTLYLPMTWSDNVAVYVYKKTKT